MSVNILGWHMGKHVLIVPVVGASEHWVFLGLITLLAEH